MRVQKAETTKKKDQKNRKLLYPHQMTINLADIGCDVAEEDVSSEINCVT